MKFKPNNIQSKRKTAASDGKKTFYSEASVVGDSITHVGIGGRIGEAEAPPPARGYSQSYTHPLQCQGAGLIQFQACYQGEAVQCALQVVLQRAVAVEGVVALCFTK